MQLSTERRGEEIRLFGCFAFSEDVDSESYPGLEFAGSALDVPFADRRHRPPWEAFGVHGVQTAGLPVHVQFMEILADCRLGNS